MVRHHRPILTAAIAAGIVLAAAAPAKAHEVNLYSARQEALIKPLLDRFAAETGIAVNLVTGDADALITRLANEGSASPADLLLTTDAGRLFRAKEKGVTRPLPESGLSKAVPAQYRDPDGHWVGLSLRARPIMVAKDRVDPASVATYERLADTALAGRICVRSSGSVYNQSLVASIIAASDPAAAERWAKGLVANFARPPKGGDRDQIKAVAAGQCDVALANTYYLAGMLGSKDAAEREAASKVTVVWPNQDGRGAHVNVSGAALAASARNVDAAVRLLEFLVTDESQAWYAEVNGEYPVRGSIQVSRVLASFGDFRADALNLGRLGDLNAEATRVMDRAGWK